MANADDAWQILLVEDEYYIADDLRRELEANGAEVIGPVSTVGDALTLAGKPGLSVAVLDVKLGDELVWPVVEALREAGVKYVLATGYGDAEVPSAYREAPLFKKPVDTERLIRTLGELKKSNGSGRR